MVLHSTRFLEPSHPAAATSLQRHSVAFERQPLCHLAAERLSTLGRPTLNSNAKKAVGDQAQSCNKTTRTLQYVCTTGCCIPSRGSFSPRTKLSTRSSGGMLRKGPNRVGQWLASLPEQVLVSPDGSDGRESGSAAHWCWVQWGSEVSWCLLLLTLLHSPQKDPCSLYARQESMGGNMGDCLTISPPCFVVYTRGMADSLRPAPVE